MHWLPPILCSVLLACGASSDKATPTGDTALTSGGAASSDATTGSTPAGSGSGGTDPSSPLACNGHVALCDRPLDEVTFPTTHNGHASLDSGFSVFNANHELGLAQQLERGVRGVLLDVYDEGGERLLCHGPCALGSIPHVDALRALRTFFEDNPREVVILLYEDYASPDAIEDDFDAAGLTPFAYSHDGGDWPTLGSLIESGTPLLVTAQSGRAPPSWLHNFWDLGFDTPYSFTRLEDMSCDLNRGSGDNALFLVNHWLSTSIGLPDQGAAPTTNSAAVLEARVRECEAEWGRPATLVAVDWFSTGDLFAVVDRLNDL